MRRFQPVEKVQMRPISCKSLAEFRRPQTTEGSKICFSGDMCVGKNTAQPASVRAKRVRRSGLHPFEHVLARAREPVDKVDRLKKRRNAALFFDLIKAAVRPTTEAQKRVRFWGPGGRLHILRASELPLRQGPGQGPGRLGAPDGAARCARAAGCDRRDTKGKGGGSL